MFTSIVQNLKGILSSESILKENKKLDVIIQEYVHLKNQSNDNEDSNIIIANDLINEIKSKILKEKQVDKKNNLVIRKEKEVLIQQLEDLIKNEKNIGKAFSNLKSIREKWTEVSQKAVFDQKEIDRKFTKRIEDFYYNINIYKAIQEHDLKRNKQLKELILSKLEQAASKKSSKELISEIKQLRTEWEGVGPVAKHLQDDFWTKYRNLLDTLYSNFEDFKTKQKEEEIKNENYKNEIINYIRQIKISELKDVKDWKIETNKVLEKQEEWKSIGFVPKESKNQLWQSYRSACDYFFGAKKIFFTEQKEIFKTNKHLKNTLCKKAEELLQSNDAIDLTREFVDMQTEWKKIGPVQQRDEQYLWHRFQKACNSFFQQKKENKQQLDADKDALNNEKETLITQLQNSLIDTEEYLLEHLSKWWKTNRYSTRKSNELEDKFKKIIENKLKNKTFQEFEGENLKIKIDIYQNFNDDSALLFKERDRIKDGITALQKDISQYENNLSFFGNSKGADALMKDVYSKMDQLNKEMTDLKGQLNLIRTSLK
jgi:hypothetical protein